MRGLLPRDLELATGLYLEGENVSLTAMILSVTSSASLTLTFTFALDDVNSPRERRLLAAVSGCWTPLNQVAAA
jgi:hypothetical protein